MMDELKDMSMDQLLDLMSQYTTQYISLAHKESSRMQQVDCKKMLQAIWNEIESRKKMNGK